ncbi:MAG: zinc-ribbon domain-containing protein [Lachnospiraceae bacterium]|nr:zinc-ribbon domain-containing protein [Lachnospiraceae bacterium]
MFCRNCGKKLIEGSKFCDICGTPVDTTPNNDTTTPAVYEETIKKTIPESNEQRDIENNKLISVLAYLGIFVLIPIFAAKDSPFAKFHSNQGLVLLLSEVILCFIYPVLYMIFFLSLMFTGSSVSGLIFLIVTILFLLLLMIIFIFIILGIVNALTGKKKSLPIIGRITILK